MRYKTTLLLSVISIFLICILGLEFKIVFADKLSDAIKDELNNLDLSAIADYFNGLEGIRGVNFFEYINGLLRGEYNLSGQSITEYLLKGALIKVGEVLPTLISVVAITILCSILQSSKIGSLSENASEIVNFVCILSIILLISTAFFSVYKNVKIAIENIMKLCEIMSPIMITLMVSVGANVSAGVYKPIVAFFISGICNLVLKIILPLIVLYGIFNLISCLNVSIKFNKLADFCIDIIKWVLGLVVAIFGLFLTVQGLTSAHFDGISLKAAKYTISSTVPIIGGLLRDGFDVVIAGSILIKNAVGIASVVALLYTILSPTMYLAILSLGLKLVAGVIEPIGDIRISNFCFLMAKTITYLSVALLMVGFCLFILVIIMTLSANVFV